MMAYCMPLSEKDLQCPTCHEVFVLPVTLKCSHTICKVCVEKHWEWNGARECPVCRAVSPTEKPAINLALKMASDSFKQRKLGLNAEPLCDLHGEQLKVFCLTEEEPICVVCQVSNKHSRHSYCPVEEAASERKREISARLTPLQKQLKALNATKEDWIETELYIKIQADKTDRQIKKEFETLHTFLWEEEAARLAVLREEEIKKAQIVKKRLENITKTIAVLSDTIDKFQKSVETDNLSFLRDFKQTKSRMLYRTPEVERIPGALIDVPKHLGLLKFNVWKKMLETINHTPITMDPNTAHPNLTFTQELSNVRYSSKNQTPNNPERCTSRMAVLGAEGFASARRTWDVEVGENRDWCIGVAQVSIQRKKSVFLNPEEGFWTISLCNGEVYWAQTAPRTRLTLKSRPRRITVDLDYEKGKVAFLDADSLAPIYTFKHKFTEKLFPYFSPGVHVEGKSLSPLKVCPLTVSVVIQ
ncbi:zinc-binding protein A33-like [Conger conger]|uniref:zinc-binding protein A33-like n=1 Tax=Conger conger TaxID=82655 RepID=UPI002A59B398|nr:zinc-binding protein A33-like [Conger conger]